MTEIRSTFQLEQTDLTEDLNKQKEIESRVLAFLKSQAQVGDVLLAYFQDGVLWGKGADKDLIIPDSPAFTDISFLHAHLFNQEREIRVIQTLEGLKAYRFADIKATKETETSYSYDRTYLLWGDQKINSSGSTLPQGFTRVRMGSRGIEQVLPLTFTPTTGDSKPQATLTVRYYLKTSTRDRDKGNLSIYARRLVSIQEGGKHGA